MRSIENLHQFYDYEVALQFYEKVFLKVWILKKTYSTESNSQAHPLCTTLVMIIKTSR